MEGLSVSHKSLFQFPDNLNHLTRFGTVSYMPNLDPLNYIVQYLWRQLCDIGIVLDGGVDLPTLHTLGKGLDLLQHIRIQHIMIHPVGFRTLFWVVVVVHAEVNVRRPVKQLLFGNNQQMATAFAEQLSPE